PGVTIQEKTGAGASTPLIRVLANNCTIFGNKKMGVLDGNGSNVGSNQSIINCGGYSNCIVSETTIQNSNFYGVLVSNSNNFSLTRNLIQKCPFFDFWATTSGSVTMTGLSIVENTVDRTALGCAVSQAGINVVAISPGLILQPKIINNTVYATEGCGSPNAEVQIQLNYCSEAIVHGNHTYGGTMGLSVESSCNDSIFSSNSFNGAVTCGIELSGGKNNIIHSNKIYGNGFSMYGIWLDGVDTGSQIENNNIYNYLNNAIFSNGVTGVCFVGNNFENEAGPYLSNGYYFSNSSVFNITGGVLDALGTTNAAYALVLNKVSQASFSNMTFTNWPNHNGGIQFFGSNPVTIDNLSFQQIKCINCGATPIVNNLSGGAVLGNNISFQGCTSLFKANGNALKIDCLDYLSGVFNFVTSASPNGSVTAGIGSTAQNESGGVSTTFWVRESATPSVWTAK
ncbi:MAG: right-handed parallel beta-helix repeat-containing protein, partial [Patescibacteria group bacterium]|nr:right-handed parallel beta-helix repeat-containing protein [Patescibacteria group bacterium]